MDADDGHEPAPGAAGGGLRNVQANFMNAVREMLNNIELVAPERDNEEEDPPAQDWD